MVQTILGAAGKTLVVSDQVRERMEELSALVIYVQGSVNTFKSLTATVYSSSEALRHAQSDLKMDPPPFDVKMIKAAHLAWLSRMEEMITGRITLEVDQVVDGRQCDFGQWYHNTDPTRFDPSVFQQVGVVHDRVHDIVRQTADRIQAGQQEEARQIVQQFEEARNELFELLDRLYSASLS